MKKAEGVKIVPAGVFPEKHEHETADFFLMMGKDVRFIKPSRTKGSKTADVEIDGVKWEMKSLSGKSKRSIGDKLSKASRQSVNIIMDMRHFQRSDNYIMVEIEKQFKIRRKIKRIWLISKSQQLVDLHR
jgi:hypothetical protein